MSFQGPPRPPAKQIGPGYTLRARDVAGGQGLVSAVSIARASVPLPAAPKDAIHRSEAWRRAVASLDCVLCGKSGETQCAHRNEGKALSMKTDDVLSAALCVACHSEIDQGSGLTRNERRERLDRAILLTMQRLARDGWIGVIGGGR